MKKNVMMRAASALGVAVLLSTCVISGTFAKYTTSATGSDTARVAKWGVEITANGTMFAESYDKDAAEASLTVKSETKVVAPGTKGELANATITGTPEVKVKVSYEADLALTGWKVDSAEYCPLVIKVGDNYYGINGMKYNNGSEVATLSNEITTITALETAVEGAIKAYTKEYATNTDLSGIGTEGYVSVSWQWAFDNDDAKDTALGNLSADANNDPKVKLEIITTVTQVD